MLSFGELGARVNRISHALRALGMQRGDHLALLLPNGLEWIEVYMAATQIGLYVTPINWHLTGEEAAYIVENCDVGVLVADARYAEIAVQAAQQAGLGEQQCYATGGAIPGFSPMTICSPGSRIHRRKTAAPAP